MKFKTRFKCEKIIFNCTCFVLISDKKLYKRVHNIVAIGRRSSNLNQDAIYLSDGGPYWADVRVAGCLYAHKDRIGLTSRHYFPFFLYQSPF